MRAGRLGLPMALAIIGGMPERFAPFAEIHREAARQAGHDPARVPLSINSHGFVADTSQAGGRRVLPARSRTMMNKIGRERGWPPLHPAGLRRLAARCAAPSSSAARRR